MVDYVREERPELRDDPIVRTKLAETKLDYEIARALATTNAAIIDGGQTPTMEASMTKVWSTDTKERVSNLAMDLLGWGGCAAGRERAARRGLRGALAWRAGDALRRRHERRPAADHRHARPQPAARLAGGVTGAVDSCRARLCYLHHASI